MDNRKEHDVQFIAKQSVKHKQKERKLRKKRKKIKQLRSFLKFIVFILMVYAIYEFLKLPQWYLPQSAFEKSDPKVIEIINNEIVPDKNIVKQQGFSLRLI